MANERAILAILDQFSEFEQLPNWRERGRMAVAQEIARVVGRQAADAIREAYRQGRKNLESTLSDDAGAGESDYPCSLTFTSSKFIVTAFGHDREHCEDVLQCVLLGRFKDHEGDREFERAIKLKVHPVGEATDERGVPRDWKCIHCGRLATLREICVGGDCPNSTQHNFRRM